MVNTKLMASVIIHEFVCVVVVCRLTIGILLEIMLGTKPVVTDEGMCREHNNRYGIWQPSSLIHPK